MDEQEKLRMQQEQKSKEEWITVYRIHNIINGQVLENILKENNIPVDVFRYEATPTHYLYTPSTEIGVIRVRQEDIDKAKRIVDDFEKDNNK